MPTFLEAFRQLRQNLSLLYEESEANAIAREFLSATSGRSYSSLLTTDAPMQEAEILTWKRQSAQLLRGQPLQQVLGYAWFMNRKFGVNEHTLIPRPETEELVTWVIEDNKEKPGIHILDVGTGSGCIAISLSLSLPEANITAIDISDKALEIAQENKVALNAPVSFLELDFLKQKEEMFFFDIIVSNPPYIPFSEKEKLDKNVRDHEPGTALFVPDDDALIFYRHLAAFGKATKSKQIIYCELHQDLGLETQQLFEAAGYEVALRKDIFNNYRMLRAIKKPSAGKTDG